MKKAYVVGNITVKDFEKWDQYRNAVPLTLAPVNAKLVCRGKLMKVLSGEHHQQDTVIIEFPNLDAVNAWYESEEYQKLIPLRLEAADIVLLSYEEDC